MVLTNRHSRSILAGYTPETLFQARALLVGCGALGQNIALDLALAGIGNIALVDFDRFEEHNWTRSPFYPTSASVAREGPLKAEVVADRLIELATAPEPHIHFYCGYVQDVGDLAIGWADIVFSAVDNGPARAYLAERCRLSGRPMVEGGFYSTAMNLSVFGVDDRDPCFRCIDPSAVGEFSCEIYAQRASRQEVLPAIQSAAATAAGIIAEQGICWLHGDAALTSRRMYLNVRTLSCQVTEVMQDHKCPGIHEACEVKAEVTANTVGQLVEEITSLLGPAEIRGPEPLVVRAPCTNERCNRLLTVLRPTSIWLRGPRCVECGGAFVPEQDQRSVPERLPWFDSDDELLPFVASLPLEIAGMPAGCLLRVFPHDAEPACVRRRGVFLDSFRSATRLTLRDGE